MKTRNKLLTLLILSAGAATTTALINKAVKLSAVSRHILESRVSLCYRWRLGNIHYTKIGEGKPVLLVHDLSPASCSYEWHSVRRELAKNHTVYTIDLLGFGRSEKPNLTYTNYLYVQHQIRDWSPHRHCSYRCCCFSGSYGMWKFSGII